jgi:phospholipase C
MATIARWPRRAAICLALLASSALVCIASSHAADPDKSVDKIPTASPIKHVIIIVGENRSFDHLFATYAPKRDGEGVRNLLSEGIIKADGSPGPNFARASVPDHRTAQRPGRLLPERQYGEQDAVQLPAAAERRRRAEPAVRRDPRRPGR